LEVGVSSSWYSPDSYSWSETEATGYGRLIFNLELEKVLA
jgi:hypothetical protein